MKVLETSPTLENLQRLLEAARSAPLPTEALIRQIRSLVFGEELVDIAFPNMASPPSEKTCQVFLKYLRDQGSKALLDFEELLIQAGHSRWVSESQVLALVEERSWNHPVAVLGYSFSRAQLPELIHTVRGWIRSESNGAADELRPVLAKLVATQKLEDQARERQRVARSR